MRLQPRIAAAGCSLGVVRPDVVALLGAACESTVVTVPTGDHPCGLFAVMGNDTTDAGMCTLAQGGLPDPISRSLCPVVSVGTSSQLAVLVPMATHSCRSALLKLRERHPSAAGFDIRPFLRPGYVVALAAPSTGGNALACMVDAAHQWARLVVDILENDGEATCGLGSDSSDGGASGTDDSDEAWGTRGGGGGSGGSGGNALTAADRDMLHTGLERAALAWSARQDSDAAASSGVASGVRMVPSFFGERSVPGPDSPYGGASLTGLRRTTFTLPAMYSACCEGIAQILADFMPASVLRAAGVTRLVGGGGALARSEVLRRAVQRVFGLPVHVSSEHRADAAVGVAHLVLGRDDEVDIGGGQSPNRASCVSCAVRLGCATSHGTFAPPGLHRLVSDTSVSEQANPGSPPGSPDTPQTPAPTQRTSQACAPEQALMRHASEPRGGRGVLDTVVLPFFAGVGFVAVLHAAFKTVPRFLGRGAGRS